MDENRRARFSEHETVIITYAVRHARRIAFETTTTSRVITR